MVCPTFFAGREGFDHAYRVMSSHSLRRLHPSLKNCVKLDVIIPYLNEEQLPTQDEYYNLTNELRTPGTRINSLIDCIDSHHEEGLGKFYRCLRRSVHQHSLHGKFASEMLQHWPQLSPKYEPSPAPAVGIRPTLPCRPAVLDTGELRAGQMVVDSGQSSHAQQTALRDVHLHFETLLRDVCASLCSEGFTVEKIRETLQRRVLGGVCTDVLLGQTTPDILSLFQVLQEKRVCHAADVDVLFDVLYQLGQEDLCQRIYEYLRTVESTSINFSQFDFSQVATSSQVVFFTFTNHSRATLSLKQVRKMKEFLASAFNIPRQLFWLTGYRDGSTILIWQIPTVYFKSTKCLFEDEGLSKQLKEAIPDFGLTSTSLWKSLEDNQPVKVVLVVPDQKMEAQQCTVVDHQESFAPDHQEISSTDTRGNSPTSDQDISSTIHGFPCPGGEAEPRVTIGKVCCLFQLTHTVSVMFALELHTHCN